MTEACSLAQFGHHPDPSTDFCIEVEDMEGYAFELSIGLNFVPPHRSQWLFWSRLSRLLQFARSPDVAALDDYAQRALPVVFGLEAQAIRSPADPIRHAVHVAGVVR